MTDSVRKGSLSQCVRETWCQAQLKWYGGVETALRVGGICLEKTNWGRLKRIANKVFLPSTIKPEQLGKNQDCLRTEQFNQGST